MHTGHRLSIVALLLGIAIVADAGVPEPECSNPAVKHAALARSFKCNMDLRFARRSPVLLVPGTYLTPAWFAWNYTPALRALGWPVCTVALPDNATAPIQDSARYVEYAIRKAHRLSGRQVQIIGFSQGGLVPRWVLRFSPATRNMVDDMVALSAPNHGAALLSYLCDIAPSSDANGVIGCPAALWQQRPDANFIAAVNDDFETVPGVDYTAIYTTYDDVIVNSGPRPSSALRARGRHVANVALQDLCPADTATHLDIGSWDPVGYAIVIDALVHKGPARAERLLQGEAPGSQALCAEAYMPGINPATFDQDFEAATEALGAAFTSSSNVSEEPPLPCYAQDDEP